MERRIRVGNCLFALSAALAFLLLSCQYVVGLHEGDFPDTQTDGDPDLIEAADDPGDIDIFDSDNEEAASACGTDTCPSGKACDESTGICVPRACIHTVRVPAGQFLMGSDESEAPAAVKPEHAVELSAFSIDACEVTVAQYKACVSEGVCSRPSSNSSDTRAHYYDRYAYDDFPVIHVPWNDARLYCEWLGEHLPTEAQWEKAARGGCELGIDPVTCDEGDRRLYPWGNDAPECTLAQFADCSANDTVEAGSRPDGASPYGALDMAGNVDEWTGDWYDEGYYSGPGPWNDPTGPETGSSKSVHGGDYQSTAAELPAYLRSSQAPGSGDQTIGFRCAL